MLLTNAKNPLWASAIKIYRDWFLIAKTKLITCDIWTNLGETQIYKYLSIMLYTKTTFLFLQDLYSAFGNPLWKELMEARTGGPIMFTVYCDICKAIPKLWKELLLSNFTDTNMIELPILNYLRLSIKETSPIRRIWIDENSHWPAKVNCWTWFNRKWRLEISIFTSQKLYSKCKLGFLSVPSSTSNYYDK